MDTILKALDELGGTATTVEINDRVAKILDIPEDVLSIEDENSMRTVCTRK